MEKAEQNGNFTVKMNQKLSNQLSKELFDVYESFKPDVVVSSHSCAALISSSVYELGVSNAPRIGIVTDYMLHPYWKGTNLDALVTPSGTVDLFLRVQRHAGEDHSTHRHPDQPEVQQGHRQGRSPRHGGHSGYADGADHGRQHGSRRRADDH